MRQYFYCIHSITSYMTFLNLYYVNILVDRITARKLISHKDFVFIIHIIVYNKLIKIYLY